MKQLIKILTLKFNKMTKTKHNNEENENNNKNEEINLSQQTQKNLIDALLSNTSKLKILKTQMYLHDKHFICDLIKENEELLNSIK